MALDETYENKLNIKTKEEQEYLMYILDSYHKRRQLEGLNAPFEIDGK